MELFQPKTSDVSQTCRLFTLYRINDQYRCVTEIVPDRGFVYTLGPVVRSPFSLNGG